MTTNTTTNTAPAPRFPAWRDLVAKGDVPGLRAFSENEALPGAALGMALDNWQSAMRKDDDHEGRERWAATALAVAGLLTADAINGYVENKDLLNVIGMEWSCAPAWHRWLDMAADDRAAPMYVLYGDVLAALLDHGLDLDLPGFDGWTYGRTLERYKAEKQALLCVFQRVVVRKTADAVAVDAPPAALTRKRL